MSSTPDHTQPMALCRPRFSIFLIVAGIVLISIAAASYMIPIACYRQPIGHDTVAGVMIHQGSFQVIQSRVFDQAKQNYLISIGGEERHDFLLLRISDHLTEFATYREYSTSLWLWAGLFLVFGVRGYVKRWVIPMRRLRRDMCVVCGYDTRGNLSGACPECGTEIALGDKTEPRP